MFNSLDAYAKYCHRKKLLEDFYPEVTSDMYTLIEDPSYDFILEGVQVRNPEKLKEVLLKEFPSITSIKYSDSETSNISIFSENIIKITSSRKFFDIISFFSYYITFTPSLHETILEPTYSKNVSDYVKNKCYGVLYHITENGNVDSIMKSGLRCKEAQYRVYLSRIFLIAIDDFANKDALLKEFAIDFIDSRDLMDFTILKINLGRNTGISFYKDNATQNENAIHTYNNIPSEYISIYKKCNELQ